MYYFGGIILISYLLNILVLSVKNSHLAHIYPQQTCHGHRNTVWKGGEQITFKPDTQS